MYLIIIRFSIPFMANRKPKIAFMFSRKNKKQKTNEYIGGEYHQIVVAFAANTKLLSFNYLIN